MEEKRYYEEIKNNLIKNEVYKKAKDYSKNRSDLETYYNVGKLLSEAGKHYGESIIKKYSIQLTNELGKKYSYRTLYKILKFYNYCKNINVSTVSAQLTWSHFDELLSIKDNDKIKYYINKTEQKNLSVRQLRELIKSNEYERIPKETKNKLINNEESNLKELVPNPIVIKNKNNSEIISEKMLHQLILENLESFMHELGDNYAFVGSEYKIKIGDRYNYIDLLLYNIEFSSYVVVELKVTELKKEHIGQIKVYMNYIDTNLKKIYQNKTIGIIICKKDNKFVMEYCSDERILAREYLIL